MTHNGDREACTRQCWFMAAGIGFVLALLLWLAVGWTFWQSLFTGIVIGVIAGALMAYIFCAKTGAAQDAQAPRSKPAGTDNSANAPEPSRPSAAAASGDVTASAAAPAAAVSTPSPAIEVQPSKKLAGPDDLASRKGDWKYDGDAPKAAPAAKKAAPKKTAAKKAPAESAKKAKTAKPKRAAVAPDGKPEMLSTARAGGADNLKLISGVGPKLEGTLNELGVWHFDQVASWRKKEIEWVDERLKFRGRIERDGWIAQAKILAKGGETEFSKRKKKT